MFADKVRLLRGEVESLADLPPRERGEREQRLADAALLPCAMLTGDTDATAAAAARMSPLARQALLSAVGAAAMAFGKTNPEPVMSAVTEVLSMAGDATAPSAVRGSALATLAVIAQACGIRLVPHLPGAMTAVLTSGRTAAASLAATAAATGAGIKEPPVAKRVGKPRSSDGHNDDDEETPLSTEESSAVELAAALAALTALIRSLGAFLSPYLKEALQLVLDPVVTTGCETAGCAAAAATVRCEQARVLVLTGP